MFVYSGQLMQFTFVSVIIIIYLYRLCWFYIFPSLCLLQKINLKVKTLLIRTGNCKSAASQARARIQTKRHDYQLAITGFRTSSDWIKYYPSYGPRISCRLVNFNVHAWLIFGFLRMWKNSVQYPTQSNHCD